ncbi:MAG: hydrolase [Armatimonadaceae bacterium]
MNRHPALLSRETSLLVVVDMQETFLNVMYDRAGLTRNVSLLCHAAQILNIPILSTTQYAERMGATVPEVREAMGPDAAPAIDKMCFSCAGSALFTDALNSWVAQGRKQIVLCGLETHICVSQTAHDLLHAGYPAHVAVDAVGARTVEKHKLGMERIRDAGILPCAAEAAVYEWLYEAGTPEFKAILKHIK